MSWKNYGDHPVVVTIGIIGVLSGIGYAIYDHLPKQEDTSKGKVVSSPLSSSPLPPTPPKITVNQVEILKDKLIGKWKTSQYCEESKSSLDSNFTFYKNGTLVINSTVSFKKINDYLIAKEVIIGTMNFQIVGEWKLLDSNFLTLRSTYAGHSNLSIQVNGEFLEDSDERLKRARGALDKEKLEKLFKTSISKTEKFRILDINEKSTTLGTTSASTSDQECYNPIIKLEKE